MENSREWLDWDISEDHEKIKALICLLSFSSLFSLFYFFPSPSVQ